jgi:hypothetical protein
MNKNIATLLTMKKPVISLLFNGDEFYGACEIDKKSDNTYIVTIKLHRLCKKSHDMADYAYFDEADFDSELMQDVEIYGN